MKWIVELMPKEKPQPFVFLALVIISFLLFNIYSKEFFINNKFIAAIKNEEPSVETSSLSESHSGTQRHILWPKDEQCKKFDVQFGHNFNLTYLASFPRSGNTWTRYLIEAATGIFTGSIYASKILYNLGYLGENDDPEMGRVIVVKSHGYLVNKSSKIFYENDCKTPVILLIRNIENSTLSFWNYFKERSFFINAKLSSYQTEEFKKKLQEDIFRWTKMNREVLVKCRNIMVIFYENLVKDPMSEVGRILQFLHFEADEERLECLRKHIEGPVKRKHKHVDPFTEEDKWNFIKSMRKVIKILESKGIVAPLEYYDYINKEIN